MLALVTFVYEWNWSIAEREFKRALELNPNDARTRAYYAWFLAAMQREERATAEAKKAVSTESLSAEVSTIAGLASYLVRRYEDSVQSERHAIQLDPNFTWAYIISGRTNEALQRSANAIPELEKARNLEPELPEALATLGHAYAVAGRTNDAHKIFSELTELSKRRHVAPLDTATVYIGLKDSKSALDWLERAYVERSYLMPSIKGLHFFNELHSEPRFKELLRKLNL
jgi:tetratricopeptide (TPR) repeat protein